MRVLVGCERSGIVRDAFIDDSPVARLSRNCHTIVT